MNESIEYIYDGTDHAMGVSAAEAAFLRYRDAGLRVPPVPRELVDRLAEQAEWLFATDARDLTDRAGFVAAARDASMPDQVSFGHIGHGVSSWWLCYRLMLAALAVFVRQSFGGAYSSQETSRSMVNATVERIEELIVLADAARRAGRIPLGQRLVVVIDDLDGSGWEVAGGAGGWRDSSQPLVDAMGFLAGRNKGNAGSG